MGHLPTELQILPVLSFPTLPYPVPYFALLTAFVHYILRAISFVLLRFTRVRNLPAVTRIVTHGFF